MNFLLSARKSVIVYMAILLMVKGDLFAQDPHFSQFYANAVYTNPAFAGSTNHGRFVTNARNQWSSISGTFTTLSAAYDEHYDIINGGIGIIISRDQAGVGLLTTNTISGAYSYQIPVNKYLTLRASIQGSLIQKTLDFGNFTWGDQILKRYGIVKPVTGETPPNPAIVIPNISAGFVAYTRTFYGGFAVHNITEPSQAFWNSYQVKNTILRRVTVHGGMQIPLNKAKNAKNAKTISPNVLFMQQGPFTELNLGLYYNKGAYILGGYFRQTTANSDAFIFLLGLRKEKLRIGYSYDATVSNARPGAPASHEVSVAIELRKRTPKTRIRAIRCPEF
jgi:type IX secretion system PorP/SprF family membrane protein